MTLCMLWAVLWAGGESAEFTSAERGRIAPSPIEETWLAAHRAYDEARYDEAARTYTALLGQGGDDGYIHYNIANAELRAGHLGKAIANYRQAQAAHPRDGDIRANLAFARKSTKDALAAVEPGDIQRTLLFWHYGLSPTELLWLSAAAFTLLWLGLVWQRLRGSSELARWITGLAFVVCLSCGGSWLWHKLLARPVAVVSGYEVEVRTGPGEDSVVRFQLHEGAEVRVVSHTEDWVRVTLPDGASGWVASANVVLE